eukprot:gene23842-biopygen18359
MVPSVCASTTGQYMHSKSETDTDTDADTNPDADADTNADTDTDADTNPDADADTNADADTYTDADLQVVPHNENPSIRPSDNRSQQTDRSLRIYGPTHEHL